MAHRTAPRRAQIGRFTQGLLLLVLIGGVVYLAKPILVPLVLAVLLTFVLTPLVIFVQSRGLGRVPAVLLVTAVTVVAFAVAGWGIGAQLATLARELPNHEREIRSKIDRIGASGAGPFGHLLTLGQPPAPPTSDEESGQRQIVVQTTSRSEGLLDLASMAGTVLEPLATAGLVLILVVFMLIRREDLRNRVIGILGDTRLTGTTRVLVESAHRLGRLLLMQLSVNVGFGILFGLGLLLIGIPYWLLWGVLSIVLRFVPYIGSWVALALPLLLSVATTPGWGEPLLLIALFLVLELVTANVIEPLLFGHSTGVSPLALLVAALFWTWIWGPVGLVLSTPLTVCLVVLGQHVPRLGFLSQLLSDQPALPPYLAYYQRLLAGDRREADAVAEKYTKSSGLAGLIDEVLLPALAKARRDRAHAGLTADDEAFVFESIDEALREFETPTAETPPDAPVILGCPSHHRAEELTLRMLSVQLRPGVRTDTVSTRALPTEIESRVGRERPELVVVAVLPPGGIVQARYLCRRLRRQFEDLRIVVFYCGRVRDFDRLLVRLRASGASYVTTSVEQTRSQIVALLSQPVTRREPAPAESPLVNQTAVQLP